MIKPKSEALQFLHEKIVGDDPELQAQLEEELANLEVSSQIYALRQEAGLTQTELANLVGTRQSVISRLEDADYDGHSLSMLNRIAGALGRRVKITFPKIEGEEAA